MTKSNERSIDVRIAELQELARNCSNRMMQASLHKNEPVQPQKTLAVSDHTALRVQRQLEALSALNNNAPHADAAHYGLRGAVVDQHPVHTAPASAAGAQQSYPMDADCPDFLWREGHNRYAVTDYAAPHALHPAYAAAPVASPWHKAVSFGASIVPNVTNIGRAAAVILVAGSFALFLATWLNSPVRAVATTDDASLGAGAIQGGRFSASNDIPARKVAVERITLNQNDNVLKLSDTATHAQEEVLNKKVKTVTLAGLTPGQFVEKSWPVPGLNSDVAAQITQIKPEETRVELAQVEATGAMNYLARGEMLLRTGDIATARLMFRKASEMGDARGAIGIASTYDPNVLRTLPVYGMQGNAQQARTWYEKAKELGASSEATARLEALSQL